MSIVLKQSNPSSPSIEIYQAFQGAVPNKKTCKPNNSFPQHFPGSPELCSRLVSIPILPVLASRQVRPYEHHPSSRSTSRPLATSSGDRNLGGCRHPQRNSCCESTAKLTSHRPLQLGHKSRGRYHLANGHQTWERLILGS